METRIRARRQNLSRVHADGSIDLEEDQMIADFMNNQ